MKDSQLEAIHRDVIDFRNSRKNRAVPMPDGIKESQSQRSAKSQNFSGETDFTLDDPSLTEELAQDEADENKKKGSSKSCT